MKFKMFYLKNMFSFINSSSVHHNLPLIGQNTGHNTIGPTNLDKIYLDKVQVG